jgi:ferredoxin
MNFKITIDNREVEVAEGQTILEAARKLDIDVPTLCFLERCGPMTSCLVCIVKLKLNGRTSVVPSCGMKVVPGMVIESETEEVRGLRRTALELLLSDHVGDCFAPCNRICPLKLNIPEMLRHVRDGHLNAAMELVRDTMPLASITGRLCNAPCEQGCRRGTWDDSMAIRDIEKLAADAAFDARFVPARNEASGKSVAIVGAGASGLAAAWRLTRDGHACTVIDRHAEGGGKLRGKPSQDELPGAVLDSEIRLLRELGVKFQFNTGCGDGAALGELVEKHDAVVLAIGESAKAQAAVLGVAAAATGIKIDPNNGRSSLPQVFVTGSAVRPIAQVTRAISEGLATARCVDQFLRGVPLAKAEKPFSSIMGKVERDEVQVFVKSSCTGPAHAVGCGSCGTVHGDVDASTEADRCLHCDCRAAGNCSLQKYSEMLGADPGRFRQQRRKFEQHQHPGNVLFEPGKCILCGICVEIAKQSAEPLGLSFIGRGFDVRVGAPMGCEFEEGLQKVARECVEGCPTGAIAFGNGAAPA